MTAIKNTFKLPKLDEIELIKFTEHRNHRVSIKPTRQSQLESIFHHHEITQLILNTMYTNEELGGNLKLSSVHGLVESNSYPGLRTVSHVDNVIPLTDNGKPGYLIKDTKGRLFKMSHENVFPKFTYTKIA